MSHNNRSRFSGIIDCRNGILQPVWETPSNSPPLLLVSCTPALRSSRSFYDICNVFSAIAWSSIASVYSMELALEPTMGMISASVGFGFGFICSKHPRHQPDEILETVYKTLLSLVFFTSPSQQCTVLPQTSLRTRCVYLRSLRPLSTYGGDYILPCPGS
jgi:hypothetical protein